MAERISTHKDEMNETIRELISSFGYGEVLDSLLPTFSRGPRKGLVKGYVEWDKCTYGGWYRGDGKGRVLPKGTWNVRVTNGDFNRGFGERASFAEMSEEHWHDTIRRAVKEIF